MATWKQVCRIALALPETDELHGHTTAWAVRGKSFAWERPLRPSDLKALGDNAPRGAILAVRVADQIVKEARLAAQPDVVFTTPHFDGYPAILIRLGKIRIADLEELIVEAWLTRAPKRLAREFLDAAPGVNASPAGRSAKSSRPSRR